MKALLIAGTLFLAPTLAQADGDLPTVMQRLRANQSDTTPVMPPPTTPAPYSQQCAPTIFGGEICTRPQTRAEHNAQVDRLCVNKPPDCPYLLHREPD